MITKVVLFDMDDTLVSELTLGDVTPRPLFFPETTKTVFEKLLNRGDHIIIASSVTSKEEIIRALQAANIDISQIKIFGNKEVNNLEKGTDGKKVTLALSYMEQVNAQKVVIVEDDTKINSNHEHVVHVQVPFYTNHTAAP